MAQPFYVQPKFAAQIETLAHPMQAKTQKQLKRGFLIWDKPLPGYKQKAVVHYLYNPSTVEANYSTGAAGANSAQYSTLYQIPGESSNLIIPMTQNASWTIMFDRTFELWHHIHNPGNQINDPSVAGVGVDVLQMMQFTGMLVNVGKKTSSTSGSNGIWPSVMLLNPCYAYFGGTGNNTVRYYGYINEWDVTYTHWTENMVPMRCVVDISFSMLPKPSASTAPSGDQQSSWIQGESGHRVGPGPHPFFGASGVGGR